MCLAIAAGTGAIPPDEPFMLKASRPDCCGLYGREPDVIAQFGPGEAWAQFEADWTDEGWKLGRRVTDA